MFQCWNEISLSLKLNLVVVVGGGAVGGGDGGDGDNGDGDGVSDVVGCDWWECRRW